MSPRLVLMRTMGVEVFMFLFFVDCAPAFPVHTTDRITHAIAYLIVFILLFIRFYFLQRYYDSLLSAILIQILFLVSFSLCSGGCLIFSSIHFLTSIIYLNFFLFDELSLPLSTKIYV